MKKLLVTIALLGVFTCKAFKISEPIAWDWQNGVFKASLLVDPVSQISRKFRCNVCSKFQITALSIPASTCENNPQNGSVAVGIIGGAPDFSIFVDDEFIGTTQEFSTLIGPFPNGNFNIKVVDRNGCSSQQTVTVANTCIQAPPCSNFQLFARNIPISVCPPNQSLGVIAVGVLGAAGLTIQISASTDGGQTFGPASEIPTSSFPLLVGLSNGNYVIKVEDLSIDCSSTQSVTLANTCPIRPLCSLPFLFCCPR